MITRETQVSVPVINKDNLGEMVKVIFTKHMELFNPVISLETKLNRISDFWYRIWRTMCKVGDYKPNFLVQLPPGDSTTPFDTRDLSCFLFETIQIGLVFHAEMLAEIKRQYMTLDNQ